MSALAIYHSRISAVLNWGQPRFADDPAAIVLAQCCVLCYSPARFLSANLRSFGQPLARAATSGSSIAEPMMEQSAHPHGYVRAVADDDERGVYERITTETSSALPPGSMENHFPFPGPQKHLTRRLTLRLKSVCENREKPQR